MKVNVEELKTDMKGWFCNNEQEPLSHHLTNLDESEVQQVITKFNKAHNDWL